MSKPFDFKSVISPKAKLTVYNPNPKPIQKDFNGDTYVFPADGTLDIYEALSWKHNREGGKDEVVLSPGEIVTHFLGDDGVSGHLGPLGCRVLSGDPETDAGIIEDARRVCKERSYINDLATKNAHMAAVRIAREAGQPVPSPDRHVVEAMQRIAVYEAEGGVLPFQCPDCAMPFKDPVSMANHQEAQHKVSTAPAPAASSDVAELKGIVANLVGAVAALTAANTPKKPGRPRKEATA